MSDLIREAEAKLHAIDHLLDNAVETGEVFITALSELTQDAYVALNDGMSQSATLCRDCAHYRNYLKNLLPILENIRYEIPQSDSYVAYLGRYRETIKELIERTSATP